METFWGALGTVIAMYVLLRAERTELRAEIRSLDDRVTGEIKALEAKSEAKFDALDAKFDRKFDGLVEMLAASGALTRRPDPPAA